jgi:hypothetical protein
MEIKKTNCFLPHQIQNCSSKQSLMKQERKITTSKDRERNQKDKKKKKGLLKK